MVYVCPSELAKHSEESREILHFVQDDKFLIIIFERDSMPTYDYKCEACRKEFEHVQSMKDEPLKKCPKCGKNKVKRLIGGGGGVLFKGKGFYETDYRSSKYKDSAKNDSGPKPEASKPASGSGSSHSK